MRRMKNFFSLCALYVRVRVSEKLCQKLFSFVVSTYFWYHYPSIVSPKTDKLNSNGIFISITIEFACVLFRIQHNHNLAMVIHSGDSLPLRIPTKCSYDYLQYSISEHSWLFGLNTSEHVSSVCSFTCINRD